jgi:pilus assembly protein Flp/PilA
MAFAYAWLRPELLTYQERSNKMKHLTRALVNFFEREDGPTAVEYAVMLALIIVVCIAAITALGSNANQTFTTISNSIANANGS